MIFNRPSTSVYTNYHYDGGLRGLVRLAPSRNTPILTLTPAPTHPHTHRLVVVVSLRVAYGPLLSPVLSPLSPTPFTWRPAKESTVPSSNITGCDASESLIACLERVGRKELFIPQEALVYPPQEGAPAHIVPSEDTASVESDLMLLLPLLLLNAAFAYAGSRPKARRPKPPPCPPQGGKKTLTQQFAYQSKAETDKAMRRSNNVKHAAPARRVMASTNRGALKGGF